MPWENAFTAGRDAGLDPLQPQYDSFRRHVATFSMCMILCGYPANHPNYEAQPSRVFGFFVRSIDNASADYDPLTFEHLKLAGDYIFSEDPKGTLHDLSRLCVWTPYLIKI